MAGLADFAAENLLNQALAVQSAGSRFLALFTTAPTNDAGTGGTEVSGGSYARQQVAGAVAATASFTTASPNITMTSNPGWVTPGMNVYDLTNNQQIGTVSTYVGTALVLTGNAGHASSGSTDSLQFSAWPAASASSGSEPAVTPVQATNGAAIAFPAATANWNTALAFGLYDAVTSGNLWIWDYLGNYAWIPASVSSASPGVLTTHAHGYSVADTVVVSTKAGGTVPSFSQSNFTGPLAVAHAATDTFDVTNSATAVNTSSTGDVMVRKVGSQSIPSGVTASFAASTLPVSLA
jgi:hypothetical protein